MWLRTKVVTDRLKKPIRGYYGKWLASGARPLLSEYNGWQTCSCGHVMEWPKGEKRVHCRVCKASWKEFTLMENLIETYMQRAVKMVLGLVPGFNFPANDKWKDFLEYMI